MLQTTTNINVDFYDKKYILINAKQYDKNSRFLSVTCYNHGELFHINSAEHSAYIRYKKADNHAVFNFCEINNKGKILVELTEQMLATDGICYVDLVIVNKGDAKVNKNTGEIVTIDNASILSTMTFCIDVACTAVENSEIESSYEFNGLNVALEKAEAEYAEVIQLARSYAIGNAGGIRENENYDNAKYYYEQSLASANNSEKSALNAAGSATRAESFAHDALVSEQNAQTYMNNAKTYMDSAIASAESASASEANAAISETNAKSSEINAKTSETNAATSEASAKDSETNAKASEAAAFDSANFAKSYTVGGTGIRENEDKDNTQYYYELVKSVVDGLNSGFIPMGTITFSELATAEKATGFTYNISDDFITDNTFREGVGKSYTAGTNVYYTADNYWDCFGGTASPTASVDEVKNYLGIE